MRTRTHSLNARFVAFAVLALAGLIAPSVSAQTRCDCTMTEPFGSCAATVSTEIPGVELGFYPDQFPANMTMVEGIGYIADLFSGRAHRFMFAGSSIQFLEDPVTSPVPGTTTGFTSRTTEEGTFFYWAGEGRLFRSDISGANATEVGTVQLEELAVFLRQELGDEALPTGRLGGIVYHPTRDTFWGVDIVNDVYFEFDETGALSQPEAPVHFFSPLRNPLAGGAYGNSITYASVGGEDFFDITVGSLADGAPSGVRRVFASEAETHSIGGDTGISYPFGVELGAPGFITGLGYIPNACAEDQHVELIFEINSQGTTRARLIGVSADAPTAANIANFSCEAEDGDVTLTWNKTLPYSTLEIRRRATDAAEDDPGQVVFMGSDFGADPEMLLDPAVPAGSYLYSAVATSDTGDLPSVTCGLTIGRGTPVAFSRVPANEEGDEPFPFGIALVGETVIVADILTGTATTFDLDLNPTGTLDGPFVGDGLTVGVTYDSSNDVLVWLQNRQGQHTLQATDQAGNPVGNPVSVRIGNASLGDLAYSESTDLFWAVDVFSGSIVSFGSDGAVGDTLPAPENADSLTGGVAVAGGEDSNLILDLPLRSEGSSVPDDLTRTVYDLSTLEALSDLFTVDLKTSIDTGDAGGVALTTVDDNQFEFLVSQNRGGVYKLDLGPTSTGSLVVFLRGDANDDGDVNISDPSFILNFMFQQGTAPTCLDAADADNSEQIDITDGIYLFNFLFRGGAAPPAPFGRCGLDAEADLTCEAATCDTAPPVEPPVEPEPGDEPSEPADPPSPDEQPAP